MPFPSRPEKMKRSTPKLKSRSQIGWIRTGRMETDCRMKATYDSHREAKKAAKKSGNKLKPYRCPVCGKYHLYTFNKKSSEE